MPTPRWFQIACWLLVLNATVVFSSVAWRFASADELKQAPSEFEDGVPDGSPGLPEQPVDSSPEADTQPPVTTPFPPPVTDPTTSAAPSASSPLDSLPVPEDLPEIPSLGDPNALEDDPVFQELRSMFSSEAPLAPSLKIDSAAARPTEAYFKTLDRRLQSAMRLCESARSIAAEAETLSLQGDNEGAEQLLRLSTQLRDIAAQLLIRKL